MRLAAAMAMAVALAAVEDGREWRSAGSGDVATLLAALAPGTVHRHEEMAMRDGVRLASEILLPPGDARRPTVLIRTPYGRLSVARYAREAQEHGCAVVLQDTRCIRGGPPRGGDPLDIVHEAEDGFDAVEWIATQAWSDGRIGMTGGSGNGMAAAAAYLAKPPHLVAVMPANTAADVARAWAFQNGVRRGMTYDWLAHRGMRIAAWPRPTLPPDAARSEALMASAATGNHVVYIGGDGWYNCFGDAATGWFRRFGGGGAVFVTIGATTHLGRPAGIAFPPAPGAPGSAPDFWAVLRGGAVIPPARIAWYVLGDPAAATGRMRSSPVWPPAGRELALNLDAAGGLGGTPGAGERRWTFDPADPAPSLGGAYSYAAKDQPGPADQRPLLERADVLRFATASLPEAVEIAGMPRLELAIACDAPDTTLVAKLVHVLPDGREILLREGVGMARYRDGFTVPTPLPADRSVRWVLPIPDVGACFAVGGSIAVYLTSSSHPAFEVHPNTWEPAAGPAQQRIARLRLDCAASRLVLPVIGD